MVPDNIHSLRREGRALDLETKEGDDGGVGIEYPEFYENFKENGYGKADRITLIVGGEGVAKAGLGELRNCVAIEE